MIRKGLSLLLILGVVCAFAGITTANVPAPPVNQIAGFDDTEFNGLTADDCKACHPSVVDAHHLLYGDAMIGPGECSLGTCDVSGDVCGGGAPCPTGETCIYSSCFVNSECATPIDYCTRGEDCPDFLCEDDSTPCTDDADCVGIGTGTCDNACPSYRGATGVCGQPVCLGGSMAPNNPNAGVYGCLACHNETNVGGVIGFEVERDCTVCHEQRGNNNVHHLDSGFTGAKAGDCVRCHGDLVDNPIGCDENVVGNCSVQNKACASDADCPTGETCVPGTCDHDIPTYEPSLVTPEPAGSAFGADVGTCDYCHAPGLDTASGVEVHDNHDTHHHSAFYYYADGSRENWCSWCHLGGRPGQEPPGEEAYAIRTCENCHGYESLHNIQVDSDTLCVYDPNDPGACNIVVGGEAYGYGHVGADDPSGDSDCFGCHGFTITSAPATGPIVPTLSDASATSITAGAETTITLTGSAFTNDAFTSVVEITGAAGSIVVAPESISVGTLTATIPALTTGSYEIRVTKEDVASNPIAISCTPKVEITDIACADGILTVTGSGFGDAPPVSAQALINVQMGNSILATLSWSDTQIVAETPACGSTVTVNALYGSASTGCTGNFDADEDVDGSDASAFKADFGRSALNNGCAADNSCNGDFDCDGDVDGTDAAGIKADFGRSAFNNACPAVEAAACGY
jgi:hypothetical protein